MKSRTHVETLLSMLLLLLSSNAFAVTMDYVGAWNATTTYLVGKVVTYNSVSYYSKLNNASNINKNRTPNTQTAYWEVIGGNTATLAANVTALQTEVTNLKTANASLTTTVNTLKTTVASLQTANTNLTNRVAAAEAVNTTQTTNITNATTRVTAAEAVNTTQNSNITNVTNRITAAEAVNTSQTTNISTLQSNNIAGLSSVLSYDTNTKNVLFSGVNVQIVNGLGSTNSLNTLGNFIVGYNEAPSLGQQVEHCSVGRNTPIYRAGVDLKSSCNGVWGRNMRLGSHNLIIGSDNDYTSYGGFVAGLGNVINADYSSVTGGTRNIASGFFTSISGGDNNRALNKNDSVSGGRFNQVLGEASTISGGFGTILNSTNGSWAVGKPPNGFKYPEGAVVE